MGKSNGIAVLLSMVIPGAGQIYKEHVFRGLLILFGGSVVLIGMRLMYFLPIYYVIQVADAYYLKEKVPIKTDGRRKNAKQK